MLHSPDDPLPEAIIPRLDEMPSLRDLFDDHYWDSYQGDKEIIMKHVDSVLALFQGQRRSPRDNGGEAFIEAGAIVIRAPLTVLPGVLEGAWAMNKFDTRYKVTDANELAKELTHALNREDEQGTTPIHELFDSAILYVIEQGGLGIEEHEDQTIYGKPQERDMTEKQIKYMVDRFLGWRLPSNFSPDAGISFTRPNYTPEVDATPSGTNLFDATQADAMVRHLIEGLPPS